MKYSRPTSYTHTHTHTEIMSNDCTKTQEITSIPLEQPHNDKKEHDNNDEKEPDDDEKRLMSNLGLTTSNSNLLYDALCKSNFKISMGDGSIMSLSVDSEGKIKARKELLVQEKQQSLVSPVVTLASSNLNENEEESSNSLFKGVSWNKKKNMWSAFVTHRKRKVFIADFKTQREAAKAYDLKCYLYRGLKSELNFGIPSQFVRAQGNVIFIPGPNMWFVKVILSDQSCVEIGYFKNADSAETVYNITRQAFISNGQAGLNYVRSFLFEKCFISTATSPMEVIGKNYSDPASSGESSDDEHDEKKQSESSSLSGGQVGMKNRKPICMVCASNASNYITVSCFHITLCDSCHGKCLANYRNTGGTSETSTTTSTDLSSNGDSTTSMTATLNIEKSSMFRFTCPVCNMVCRLEKIDEVCKSVNLSDYIPTARDKGTSFSFIYF